MKRRIFYSILAVEAAALAALSLAGTAWPQWFSSAMAFPLEQIGSLLQLMSGGSAVMRGAALALWLGLGLLPLVITLSRGVRGRWLVMPAAMSAVLLAALRFMTAPAVLVPPGLSADGALSVLRAVIGGSAWSAAVCWLVVHLLRLFRQGEREQLLKYMRLLLHALCVLFVGAAILPGFGEFTSAISAADSAADKLAAALSFCVGALPCVMDLAITLRGIILLDAMLSGDDPSVPARAAAHMGCTALAAEAISVMAFNILQLFLSPGLTNIRVSVSIPVMSLAFALASLLGARIIEENRRLSDDSGLII